MGRSLLPFLALLFITLTSGGCERRQRVREREAIEERARAERASKEAARLAALPPPEEPPVETVRVPHSELPCALDDVFARKCRRCHTVPTRHGAPFVFFTWDDTRQDRLGQPLYTLIGRAVASDFMPYKIEANPPVAPLTPDEKKLILDWVAAGGPKGSCDPAAAASSAGPPSEKRPPPPMQAAPKPPG